MTFSRSAGVSAGLAICAVVFGFAGCGSDVKENTGGAGTTTATTVANVSASISTNTVGSTTIAATSSTGGNTVCDEACAKASTCGFDVCSQLPLGDCSNPTLACAAGCINDGTCDDIMALQSGGGPVAACIQGCLGQQQNDCATCVGNNMCFPQGCLGNNDCQGWAGCLLQCAQGNMGPTCYSDCDTAHPEAAAFQGPFYDCACTSCATDCQDADPCSLGAGGGGTGGAGGSP